MVHPTDGRPLPNPRSSSTRLRNSVSGTVRASPCNPCHRQIPNQPPNHPDHHRVIRGTDPGRPQRRSQPGTVPVRCMAPPALIRPTLTTRKAINLIPNHPTPRRPTRGTDPGRGNACQSPPGAARCTPHGAWHHPRQSVRPSQPAKPSISFEPNSWLSTRCRSE